MNNEEIKKQYENACLVQRGFIIGNVVDLEYTLKVIVANMTLKGDIVSYMASQPSFDTVIKDFIEIAKHPALKIGDTQRDEMNTELTGIRKLRNAAAHWVMLLPSGERSRKIPPFHGVVHYGDVRHGRKKEVEVVDQDRVDKFIKQILRFESTLHIVRRDSELYAAEQRSKDDSKPFQPD